MKAKKIVISLVVLIISPIIALMLFISQSYNVKKIESEINAQINNEISKTQEHYLLKDKEVRLKIGGVKMNIFPATSLIVSNLEIKNIQHQNITLNGAINTIKIKLRLKDILRKNVNLNDITIGGANINLEKSILTEYYLKQERVKKMVKLEGNEVLGLKGKLKEILTGKQDPQVFEDGYKEVDAEETVRVDLDNRELKNMFVNMIKSLSTEKIKHNAKDRLSMELIDINLNLLSNNSVVKEYRNIAGKMSRHGDVWEYKLNFILSNIFSYFNGKMTFEGDKVVVESEILNESNDKTNIYLRVNNNILSIDDWKGLVGEKRISAKVSSLNTYIQWLFPTTSPYYTKFNYKKGVEFTVGITDIEGGIAVNDLTFKSEDLAFSGSGIFGAQDKIELDITKADMNSFIIQKNNQTREIKPDDIDIFRAGNMDELLELIKNKTADGERKNLDLKVKIDNYINKTDAIKNSEAHFEINEGYYKIKTFQLNFNDLNINISGEEKINDFYVNDLKVSGSNIKSILKYFNAENFVDFEAFELNSKLFAHDNIIYLKDFSIYNDTQNLRGDVEFSLSGDKKYFASNLHIDKLNIKTEDKQYKTVKEQLIWLGGIENNVFVNLTVDDLTFNNVKNIYFDGSINYKNNLLNFYNIKNITFDNAKNVSGKFEVGIKSSKPFINMSLNAESAALELELLDFFVNIGKYQNLVFDDKVEESQKYWINKLFILPNWIDVNGKINFKVKELKINSKNVSNLNFASDVNNGSFSLKNFSFAGFGGETELRGKIDLKDMKSVELILSDTSYNIGEITQLITNSNTDAINGVIGINFILKAQGYNKNVFLSSMTLDSKFIGRDLYVKKLGLAELENKLRLLLVDNNILNALEPKEIILNNSGTLFREFSGSLLIAKNILNLSLEAMGEGYSNKLLAKVDGSQSKNIFNFNNVSSMVLKVGNNTVPLYTAINFLEDLQNKANMTIDTKNVDEYVNLLRKEVKKNDISPK